MKKFIILWVGQSISSLGSGMTAFALIVWIYSQKGTATSVTMLSFFTYLPSILFCFIAGTLADKWDKKKTMLVSDFIAAIGTSTVFILYATGNLEIWHLYVVNFVIGLMGAFQSPASSVAFSLIVPKDKYVKASGMQGFSGSLNSILTPILATSILAFGGLEVVFTVDL
ncbi:MAG: MFS transporter, partial [Oscillospiraceae bacterium]|nr:MFS transporter [Oscillospiraceae bacterium]